MSEIFLFLFCEISWQTLPILIKMWLWHQLFAQIEIYNYVDLQRALDGSTLLFNYFHSPEKRNAIF